MLTKEIAERIVSETMERVARNINMMDRSGRIMASGDQTRIGSLHIGAREAIATSDTVFIESARLSEWPGAQAGINMPIVFQGQTVGAIGISGEPQQLIEVAQLVRMTAEMMLRQAFLSSQQAWRIRMQEMVLEEVLRPAHQRARIEEWLHMLHVKPKPPFWVGLIRLREPLAYNHLLLRKIEELHETKGILSGLRDEWHLVTVAFDAPDRQSDHPLVVIGRMLAHHGQPNRIGYSSTSDEWAHIPQLLEEARLALSYTKDWGEHVSYEGLEPHGLLRQADQSQRMRFSRRLLAPLDETLRETLRVFLNCDLHIAQAADSLYVHKNTVIYRLRKIREMTACDPQRFTDAMRLQAALWCEEENSNH